MDAAILWDITPCSPYVKRRFGGTYHLHLQGLFLARLIFYPEDGRDTTGHYIPQDGNIRKLIRSVWIKEDFSRQCEGFVIAPTYEKGNRTDNTAANIQNYQLHKGSTQHSSLKVNSRCRPSYWGHSIIILVQQISCHGRYGD
jgi:hypothetical protein